MIEVTLCGYGGAKQFRIASIIMVSLCKYFFVSKQSHLISNLASLGILLELFWPVNNEPPYGRLIKPGGTEFYKPMNWQHSTMYFFFLLYGSCRLMNARFMLLKGKRK